MLHEFLSENHDTLVERCKDKVARRSEPSTGPEALNHGVPLFLQQLVETLRAEHETLVREDADAPTTTAQSAIGRAAALHGAELLRRGFKVDQVVHEYGDVCQSVTDLAIEKQAPISTDEFRTLNRCLDNAIADAVSAFGSVRQGLAQHSAGSVQTSMSSFAEEHQRLIDIATQALAAIKTGNVGPAGATGALLAQTLAELRYIAERNVREVGAAMAAHGNGGAGS